MPDIHAGGCLCGAIRYQVQDAPSLALVCHCKFCQRRSGSAFAVIAYFEDHAVQLTKGSLLTYEHRSDESRRWLRASFCTSSTLGRS